MSDILIDYEKQRVAIARLRKLSEELSAAQASLTAIWGQVGGAWQGIASDAFLETGEWTAKDLQRLRFEMEDLARDIETALSRLDEA